MTEEVQIETSIEEPSEGEKKKWTSYFMIGGSIALVAILGFIVFGLKSNPTGASTVEYNYFEFEEIGGLWQTNIQLKDQLYQATFRFNPEQVEDIYVEGNFSLVKSPIYVTFDPDADSEKFKYLALASSELSLNLIRGLNLTLEGACTKNVTDACIDRQIVTCADTDKSVIYLVSNPPTQITLQENCIVISGEGFDLLKSVDRLLFKWYNIMK